MKKVAYVGGYWSTNVGNGFFNLGADYVLKQVFGDDNVTMVFDQSAYVPGWKKTKGNVYNSVDYNSHLCIDYIVLLGPVLSRNFLPIWKNTLDELKKRGIGYLILSAGMMKYDEEVIREIKEYFAINPPFAMTTRDHDTFTAFKNEIPLIYDGVCFAFFVPDAYIPISTDFEKSIVLNFDKIDEPALYFDQHIKKPSFEFEFEGHHIEGKFKGLFSNIALKTDRFTDAIVYAASVFPIHERPDKLGDYSVIRTDHRFSPLIIRKVYRYTNSFCADIPHTYANIYANASLTISDRVHACAIALAYGNSAILLAKTNRSTLLERVGAVGIGEHPVTIDLNALSKDKQEMVNWLKSLKY